MTIFKFQNILYNIEISNKLFASVPFHNLNTHRHRFWLVICVVYPDVCVCALAWCIRRLDGFEHDPGGGVHGPRSQGAARVLFVLELAKNAVAEALKRFLGEFSRGVGRDRVEAARLRPLLSGAHQVRCDSPAGEVALHVEHQKWEAAGVLLENAKFSVWSVFCELSIFAVALI